MKKIYNKNKLKSKKEQINILNIFEWVSNVCLNGNH